MLVVEVGERMKGKLEEGGRIVWDNRVERSVEIVMGVIKAL